MRIINTLYLLTKIVSRRLRLARRPAQPFVAALGRIMQCALQRQLMPVFLKWSFWNRLDAGNMRRGLSRRHITQRFSKAILIVGFAIIFEGAGHQILTRTDRLGRVPSRY